MYNGPGPIVTAQTTMREGFAKCATYAPSSKQYIIVFQETFKSVLLKKQTDYCHKCVIYYALYDSIDTYFKKKKNVFCSVFIVQ